MGLTKFPNGILATPMVGAGVGRFDGMWGKTYFVDYDHGSGAGDGLSPDTAKQHLQQVLDLMTMNDVVYIRNRDQDTTTTDPEYILPASTTNWSITESQRHLSVIGASNLSHLAFQGSPVAPVYLRGNATATTGPVFEIKGAYTLLENLAFHRGAVTSGGLVKLTGNSTSLRAFSSAIVNCYFHLYSQSDAALYNVDNWGVRVHGCDFRDCATGIKMHGSSSTMRRTLITGCLFRFQTAASVGYGILYSGSGGQDNTISYCDFVGEIPTAGGNYFISADAAIQGTIIHCGFPADTTESTTYINANGFGLYDCHQTKWTADAGNGGAIGT